MTFPGGVAGPAYGFPWRPFRDSRDGEEPN